MNLLCHRFKLLIICLMLICIAFQTHVSIATSSFYLFNDTCSFGSGVSFTSGMQDIAGTTTHNPGWSHFVIWGGADKTFNQVCFFIFVLFLSCFLFFFNFFYFFVFYIFFYPFFLFLNFYSFIITNLILLS